MKLINQHTKGIMEECKARARDAGLKFDDESLEYMVTNRDMIELSPKIMIPTLYDYWVHDVFVLQGEGRYKLNPNNPYETVINSRPAISFYNDNNPDWLNVMIFYHVLGHVDFFQNNCLFEHTWKDDFVGQALADKRLITKLRSEHGHWVDYVIEFARGIDNLVDYHGVLSSETFPKETRLSKKLDFYFNDFLQKEKKVSNLEFLKEVDHYNLLKEKSFEASDSLFFSEVNTKYPEFNALFKKFQKEEKTPLDLMDFIIEYSPFLNEKDNEWMKSILMIVKNTSLYFQPQIRTKIFDEGWASYWHQKLFMEDPRMKGHEVDFAILDAKVTSLSRVGLNPYAVGLKLIQHVENLTNQGKSSYEFKKILDVEERENFDLKTGKGKDFLFRLREISSDFDLINSFVDDDFVKNNDLFVVGKRPDFQRQVWQYYVKSRKAEDYKQMLIDHLYHPPKITFKRFTDKGNTLFLSHKFEGKQLVEEQISNTLIGIEYLWGGPIKLKTVRLVQEDEGAEPKRVPTVYSIKDREIKKRS